MYSIKAAAHATGLTVETLRAWERRYGVVTPQRDARGRRTYAAADVLRLRRLREAISLGHPISRLARLDEAALLQLVSQRPPPPALPEEASSAIAGRVLAAAEHFALEECERALAHASALLPPASLVDEVLAPVLHQVGERWHAGTFSVAQEHMVSAAVRKHVGLVLDLHARTARAVPIVFATLPGERHEFGLLMAALVCASHGCKVHYLGPDVPVDDIALYANRTGAAVVALSAVVGGDDATSVAELTSQVERLAERLGRDVSVWLGGRGAHGLAVKALPKSCAVVRDQAELERRLEVLVR
jgi:DNA-binding transcriptional MerR regulator/methylmalonyl-CoA mutase cobalamin-binding subunit